MSGKHAVNGYKKNIILKHKYFTHYVSFKKKLQILNFNILIY